MNINTNIEINAILSALPSDSRQRLDYLTRYFLGRPYVLTAQGEGEQGRFDQQPLFRLDAFDCLTFVSDVLALFYSTCVDDVIKNYVKMNYYDDMIDLTTRFHFTSLDWNIQNNRHHFIKDVTTTLCDEEMNSVACSVCTVIDKQNWFRCCGQKMIRLNDVVTINELESIYAELLQRTERFSKQSVKIDYIPLTVLFDDRGNPNNFLFAQFPDGAILEIVRPAWDLTQKIGTHLHVSHLGFIFRESGELIFRHASADYSCIVQVSLVEYLKSCRNVKSIGGVNVQTVF